jgi:hypothetical protein
LSIGSNTVLPIDFIAFFKQNEFNTNINFTANYKANIKLFALSGSQILSEDILLKAGNTIFTKTVSVPSGVYVAVLKSEGKSVSKKIIKK